MATNTSTAVSAGCSTFTCFPRLPLELRLLVWEAALSALPAPSTLWTYNMTLIGSPTPRPRPCRLGLSCKEAWQVVQRRCVRFKGPPGPRPVWCWADPNNTLVHLNDLAALDKFERGTALKLKHLLVTTCAPNIEDVLPLCQELCNSCPALETLAVECESWKFVQVPPDVGHARLLTYAGPELGTDEDHRRLRSRLAASVISSPRVHIITFSPPSEVLLWHPQWAIRTTDRR